MYLTYLAPIKVLADRLVGQSFSRQLLLLLVLSPNLVLVQNLVLVLKMRFQCRFRQSYLVLEMLLPQNHRRWHRSLLLT
jgi:hypothetical protein